MSDFNIINIQDLLLEIGEENLSSLLETFSSPKNREIEVFIHNRVLDFVHEVVANIQYMIGGGILYLECEDNPFLLDFYQNTHNCFHLFGERKSDSGTLYKLLYKFV